MSNWTKNDLKRQYTRIAGAGWISFFKTAGADYDFDPLLLMAIASRETNIRNIIGDNGHGYGIMQIDDRSFPQWCNSGVWKDPEQAILKGAHSLDGKRTNVQKNQGKKVKFGDKTFIGASNLTDTQITTIATSSYNCGWWAYYNFSLGNDVDKNSTGKDYSKDVSDRLSVFIDLSGG